MNQEEIWAFSYFGHESGFGYNLLQVTKNPIQRGFNYTFVAVDGEYGYKTLDDAVNGLKKRRDDLDGNHLIMGYLNAVTDFAQKSTKNPRRLSPSEEQEFIRKLFS